MGVKEGEEEVENARLMAAPTAVSSWITGSPLSDCLWLTMISRSMPSFSMMRLIALRLTCTSKPKLTFVSR